VSRPSPRPPCRRRRRAALPFCIAALAAVSLSGCAGTGVGAQTNARYQSGVGANVPAGAVQLYNALAVDNGSDTATVSVTILNTTGKALRLTSAEAHLSGGKKLRVTTAPAIIDGGQTMATGPAGAIIVAGPGLEAGKYVALTLRFSGGRKATVDAPVVARSTMYDDVATGPGGETATPTPTPTPSPSPAAGSQAAPSPAGETLR
jgi:copper(I)-binding protein